jgi:hypothetical protein
VPCSERLRVEVAHERGKDIRALMLNYDDSGRVLCPYVLMELQKEHPKFCGDCRDHGLIALRLEAIQRMRKRVAETLKDRPAKRLHVLCVGKPTYSQYKNLVKDASINCEKQTSGARRSGADRTQGTTLTADDYALGAAAAQSALPQVELALAPGCSDMAAHQAGDLGV